ncbi:MAG: hypothetical protein HY718_16635 [Planctomycetes bacterium]|nr:hypothetical protein [Planctomycetota bacterium]
MVIPRVNLKGLEIDLAGAAAVIAVLVAGYLLLLRIPLEDAMAGAELIAKQRATAQAIGSLQKEYVDRFRRLKQAEQTLAMRASWLTRSDLPGEVLGRINELARQGDVRIIRWQPRGLQVLSEYQVQLFSVEGAAAWPSLLRWLALIEEGVPLLDVTHFTVNTPATPGQVDCDFSCSLKLYLGGGGQARQVAAVER